MRAELKRETAVAVEEMLNRLNVALNPLLENINGRIRKEDFEIILPEDVPHITNAAVIAAEEDNELIDLRFKLKEIKTKQNELQQVIENMQGGTEYEELTKALQVAREEILKSKNEVRPTAGLTFSQLKKNWEYMYRSILKKRKACSRLKF